jgi:capsular polysaccharide biosynthesis protein
MERQGRLDFPACPPAYSLPLFARECRSGGGAVVRFSLRDWLPVFAEESPADTLCLRQRRVASYGWEEVLIPSVPCFGTETEPWVAKRRVPKKGSATIRDATVYGGLFAVVAGKTLWQTDPCIQLPYFSANYSRHFQTRGRRHFLPVGHITKRLKTESALLIGNRVSGNYFHWMFECLPALVADKGSDPIIVSAEMPPQLYEALALANVRGRPVIQLGRHDAIEVGRLRVRSSRCYLPDDRLLGLGRAAVSPKNVRLIGKHFRRLPRPSRMGGNLLWVSRTRFAQQTGTRNVVNAEEIERYLLGKGADVFHPHAASLAEQRSRFRNAQVIVMPAGAAFSSVVFCRPGAAMLLLAHAGGTDLGFFAAITAALGVRVAIVYGIGIPQENMELSHWSYRIDFSRSNVRSLGRSTPRLRSIEWRA